MIHVTCEQTQQATNDSALTPVLLNVREVAGMLHCSGRHIYRLCDAGKFPKPIKLGTLSRWRKNEMNAWIDAGCPTLETEATDETSN